MRERWLSAYVSGVTPEHWRTPPASRVTNPNGRLLCVYSHKRCSLPKDQLARPAGVGILPIKTSEEGCTCVVEHVSSCLRHWRCWDSPNPLQPQGAVERNEVLFDEVAP